MRFSTIVCCWLFGAMVCSGYPLSACAQAKWPNYSCVIKASKAYHINPWIIVGIMKTEDGKPGQFVRDSNGTYDIGPMQINSIWLRKLRSLGITPRELADNGCLNIDVGSAILAMNIKAANGNIARGIGWYHSHTPRLARQYRHKVAHTLKVLEARK